MENAITLDTFEDVEVGGADESPPLDDAAALDLWAERRMWRIRQLLEEQQKNTAQADELRAPLLARIDMVDSWLIEQNHALQQQIDFLTQQIEQVALAYPFDGKSKSRKMPAGTFGKRAVPEKLDIVDKDTAVAFAKDKGVPYRVKEEPDARALREFFESTGTVPAGCAHVPGYEKPYVRIQES